MILYALGGKFSRDEILYQMSASLVNQLMGCYWMEQGNEIEGVEEAADRIKEMNETLERMRKPRKIKFDF